MASSIRNLENRIRSMISRGNNKMGTSYDTLVPVVDNLIGGYKEASWIDLGEGTTFDVKEVCLQYGVDYKSLTNDNFVSILTAGVPALRQGATYQQARLVINKNYDSDNGVLTHYLQLGTTPNGGGAIGYTDVKTHVYLLLAKKATDAGNYVDLGSGQSFDVKPYCEALDIDYKGLTADDFVALNSTNSYTSGEYGTGSHWGNVNWTKSYNKDTGILTWYYKLSVANTRGDAFGDVHAYLMLAKKVTKVYDLGTGQTFDVKTFCLQNGLDYTKLTNDNFLVSTLTSPQGHYSSTGGSHAEISCSFNKTYNQSTGVLNCYLRLQSNFTPWNSTGDAHVYLVV